MTDENSSRRYVYSYQKIPTDAPNGMENAAYIFVDIARGSAISAGTLIGIDNATGKPSVKYAYLSGGQVYYSDYESNTVQFLPGRSYDGYTDLLSYIVHLKRDKNIFAGRFDAINLTGLETQNWDYMIDFTFDAAGQAVVVKASALYSYIEKIAYANKKADGTFGWNGGWKTISYT